MSLSRNQQNYIIMTVIYDELTDFVIDKGRTFRDARDLIAELSECEIADIDPYILQVVTYALQNYGNIIALYKPNLKNWLWERLPLLTQAILLMSVAHANVEKVDKKVLISIAVDLAKKYVEEKQAKFIHALLDNTLDD